MSEEYNKNFEMCVRGIIQHNDKILVGRDKGKDYYFFPGGHVDFSETAQSALHRELIEELDISIDKLSFVGVVENIYSEEGEKHHELNIVFNVKAGKVKDKSKEDHIDFFFFDVKRFSEEDIRPIALRDNIVAWLKDRRVFWASQI